MAWYGISFLFRLCQDFIVCAYVSLRMVDVRGLIFTVNTFYRRDDCIDMGRCLCATTLCSITFMRSCGLHTAVTVIPNNSVNIKSNLL